MATTDETVPAAAVDLMAPLKASLDAAADRRRTRDAMPAPLIHRDDLDRTLASPDSCALCGIGRREHCQHYFGRHSGDERKGYVAPDTATRLARMKARRAAGDPT